MVDGHVSGFGVKQDQKWDDVAACIFLEIA